jgi:hypothetical protein
VPCRLLLLLLLLLWCAVWRFGWFHFGAKFGRTLFACFLFSLTEKRKEI